MGTKVETVFFILTQLGHGWNTGAKGAQEVYERDTRGTQEVHERCTRGAREGHERDTRGAREVHERCTRGEQENCPDDHACKDPLLLLLMHFISFVIHPAASH